MGDGDLQAGGWQCCAPDLADDRDFVEAVQALHREAYEACFADDLAANHRLGVQVRAFRRLQEWRLLLVLTPWMYSRLLVPDRQPEVAVPAEWTAQRRQGAPYQVLGPAVRLQLLGQPQRAHLNFHSSLGHYLLQPLALNMEPYDSPEAVFAAWNQVIRTRDDNMEKHKKDCPWQKEVSRRELFERFRRDS